MSLDYKMEDWKKYINSSMGKEDWITVYERSKKEDEECNRYCAIVNEKKVPEVLNNSNWELRMCGGKPGYTRHFNGRVEYNRFACCEPVEPLVYYRSFPDDPSRNFIEFSEEFRHFHDLFQDEEKRTFCTFDDDGDPVEVIRLSNSNKIDIHVRYLKEFLAVKKMSLLLYYEIMRFSKETMAHKGVKVTHKSYNPKNIRYDLDIYEHKNDGWHFISSILGKKIIEGLKNYDLKAEFEPKKQTYESFIIGIDKNGQPIRHTCDLNHQRDRNKYYYLPVYFKRQVLEKYYNNPQRYEVEGFVVRSGGKWRLQIDNDRKDCVVAQLGYLGILPPSEQKHWENYNIEPKNGFSRLASLLWSGIWNGEPEMGDILFKSRFWLFQKNWHKKFGWNLFKPFRDDDEYVLKKLHVPLDKSQSEFDDQVNCLAKILPESINEEELVNYFNINRIEFNKEKDKSITKLEKFLQNERFPQIEIHIKFLRNLQDLRSGEAHRKGSKYENAIKNYNVLDLGFIEGIDYILKSAVKLLDDLAAHFHIQIKLKYPF